MADPAERARNARALFASVHGIVALARDRKIGSGMPEQIERQIRFVVRLFARGLGAKTARISARALK